MKCTRFCAPMAGGEENQYEAVTAITTLEATRA